jgi:toxin FitB
VIILDTNVISEPLKPAPSARVVAWLDSQLVETMYLTAISLAEVRFGMAALPTGRRRRTLQHRFEEEFIPLFSGRVLAFDEPASAAYAELRSRARKEGLAMGVLDALIAGIARSRSFLVATRDTAPFAAAGVPVIDPFSESA